MGLVSTALRDCINAFEQSTLLARPGRLTCNLPCVSASLSHTPLLNIKKHNQQPYRLGNSITTHRTKAVYLNSGTWATRRRWVDIHLSSNPCNYELLLLIVCDRGLDSRFILLLIASLHCSCYITDGNDGRLVEHRESEIMSIGTKNSATGKIKKRN